MHVRYNDIVSRVSEPPVWWLRGVPRYGPFRPGDATVYGYQIALVHTRCQSCGQRYDVAAEPEPYRNLRNVIAFESQLDIGDPPNVCHNPPHCTGTVMTSDQIAVLEFWERDGSTTVWTRDPTMERPLVDAERDEPGKMLREAVFFRIHESDRKEEWMLARREGHFARMAAILNDFGCERPREVAHMLDLERRRKALFEEFTALHEERFGRE